MAGPALETLIDPVTPEELKQAMLATLEGWGKPLLEKSAELLNPGYQPYCVLTLCRILYTLEYNAIASKPAAACWAQARLGEPWDALIERAWAGRHNPGMKVLPEDISETLSFIRFTLDRSPQRYTISR